MLGWSLVFALLAVVAAALGYFGIAGVSADIAWLLCIVFLVLLVASFIGRALRGQSVD